MTDTRVALTKKINFSVSFHCLISKHVSCILLTCDVNHQNKNWVEIEMKGQKFVSYNLEL